MRRSKICQGVIIALVLFSFGIVCRAEPTSAPLQKNVPPFLFQYHELDQVYMDPILAASNELHEKISKDIGFHLKNQIKVVMALSEDEFNQFQAKGYPLPEWAAGVAYPKLNLMVIRSPRLQRGPKTPPLKTFTHELAHLILAAGFGNRPIPRWLNEGLAMYESYEWHPAQDLRMTIAVLSGGVIPLEELTGAFGGKEFEVQQAYVQSYSLVNFLISTYGQEGFQFFVHRLARGKPFQQALEDAFHLSPQTFQTKWKRHLRVRFNWIPFLTSTTVLWFVISSTLFFVYLIRKHRNQKIIEEWEKEEESL